MRPIVFMLLVLASGAGTALAGDGGTATPTATPTREALLKAAVARHRGEITPTARCSTATGTIAAASLPARPTPGSSISQCHGRQRRRSSGYPTRRVRSISASATDVKSLFGTGCRPGDGRAVRAVCQPRATVPAGIVSRQTPGGIAGRRDPPAPAVGHGCPWQRSVRRPAPRCCRRAPPWRADGRSRWWCDLP